MTSRLKLLKATWLLAGIAGAMHVTLAAQANGEVVIYDIAPSADELADTMFPVRYRSVVLKSGETTAPKPKVVGMLINFEFDSTQVRPESLPFLAAVGDMLSKTGFESETVLIEGHTDASGEAGYNQQLSLRRAGAVRDYLVNQYGIDPQRLVVAGKGEAEPYSAQDPGHAINRRVQFQPLTSQVAR